MIEIDAKSAQSTIERLARVNKDIERQFSDFLKVKSLVLERKIKDEITKVRAVDTGQARGSIHATSQKFEAQVAANAKHAAKIEFGQEPGTWPEEGAIERWESRKKTGIPVRLIERKIFRKGIDKRPFFYPTWINYKGTFHRDMIALFKQIVQK